MKYGICIKAAEQGKIPLIKKAGFDYIEHRFSDISFMTEETYGELKALVREYDIPCYASNVFLPGDIRVTGGIGYDKAAFNEYLVRGMERGCEIGMKTVVFGSGGARNMPEGYCASRAFMELSEFLIESVAPVAGEYKVTVVIEPLGPNASNIINTVKEGAYLAATAKSEYIADLADNFHMDMSNDSFDNIRALRGMIKHGHIACPIKNEAGVVVTRVIPTSADEYDYRAFVDALRAAGCESCSIEAGSPNFDEDIFKAAEVLRAL